MNRTLETIEEEEDALWLPYEDKLLWSIKDYLKEEMTGENIQMFFPHRTFEECSTHWSALKDEVIYQNQSLSTEITKGCVAKLPDGMGTLPMIPLLKVCSFLTPKEVFTKMTLVCKHYNEIIKGYQIPFDRLEIDTKSHARPSRLLTLVRRMDSCRELVVQGEWFNRYEDLWEFCFKRLLEKIQPKIESLMIDSEGHPAIMDFISGSPCLKTCNLTIRQRQGLWEWDPLKRSESVKRLHGRYNYMSPRFLNSILHYFPSLEFLELRDSWNRPMGDLYDNPLNWTNSQILHLEGDVVPFAFQIPELRSWDLYMPTMDSYGPDQLLRVLPKLPELRCLRIYLSSSIVNDYETGNRLNPYMGLLMNAIKQCEKLIHLELLGAVPEDNDRRNRTIKHRISFLPKTIRSIVYKETWYRKIRPEVDTHSPSSCSQYRELIRRTNSPSPELLWKCIERDEL
jgi:hypothetical protein